MDLELRANELCSVVYGGVTKNLEGNMVNKNFAPITLEYTIVFVNFRTILELEYVLETVAPTRLHSNT